MTPSTAATTTPTDLPTATEPAPSPTGANYGALPFHLDSYDRWDLVLIAPMLLLLPVIMFDGFYRFLPASPFFAFQQVALLASAVFLARRLTRSWRLLLPWLPVMAFSTVAIGGLLWWLWAAGEWGFFGGEQLQTFALWALLEEVVFRVVLIDLAYVALRRFRLSHAGAAVAAVVVTGVLFVVQPGHIIQTGWTWDALSFFYYHLLFALPRLFSGVLLPGVLLHLAINVGVEAGRVIPAEAMLRPGITVAGVLLIVGAVAVMRRRDRAPRDPLTGELLGPIIPPALQRLDEDLQARLAAARSR